MKNIIIYTFVAFIFFTIGFGVSEFLQRKNFDPNDTYAVGWAAAEKKLEDFLGIDTAVPITNLSGFSVDFSDNKLKLQITPLFPLDSPDLNERIIKIDQNTEIVRVIQKDTETIKKEQDEFLRNNPDFLNSPIGPGGPSRFTEQKVGISELKENLNISVKTDYDIKKEKEFIAKKITILLQ